MVTLKDFSWELKPGLSWVFMEAEREEEGVSGSLGSGPEAASAGTFWEAAPRT